MQHNIITMRFPKKDKELLKWLEKLAQKRYKGSRSAAIRAVIRKCRDDAKKVSGSK